MVPIVVPKYIKSKSMMFWLSKTVFELILLCFIDFLHPFQLWDFLELKKLNFHHSSPKFENKLIFWVPSNIFSESIIINLFEKKMYAITHLPRFCTLDFVFFRKFANIDILHILVCRFVSEYSTTLKFFHWKVLILGFQTHVRTHS